MSKSTNHNDKGKTIMFDSSSSDSESESTRDDLNRHKGKRIVNDPSSSKSDDIDTGSTSNKHGSQFDDEGVDDDSHQVPSNRKKICGCLSRRPCSSYCPNVPMGNSGSSHLSRQRTNVTTPRPLSIALPNFQSNQIINFPSNEPRNVVNTPQVNFGIQTQRLQYLQTIFVAQSTHLSWGILDVPTLQLASILGAGFTNGSGINHATILLPQQQLFVYSDNIQLSPNYYEQPPLTYLGIIYLWPEYYELVRFRPINPVHALSSHQYAPSNIDGAFRPVTAQPNPSSLEMLQNYANPEIAIIFDIDDMSYEDLIRLGEIIGVVPTGLSEQRIYELMWRSSYSVSSEEGSYEMNEACVVCLESFSVGEDVGTLYCMHVFHTVCIVPWLQTRNSCPICRGKALVIPDE